VLAPEHASRRVVVKGRYHDMGEYGRKAAALHLRYLQRDGVEKDGSEGVLYGRNGQLSADAFLEPIEGEQRQYRFMVSPEDAGELDLTDFTRRLVAQMEVDLGRPLVWTAANHYNTDQPHAHLVIRGVDGNGRELWIDRDYFTHGIRNRAREIATQELGLRTQQDIDRQLDREIGQERLTSIDREIAKRLSEKNAVSLRDQPSAPWALAQRTRLVARLGTLEKLGLAQRRRGAEWVMAGEWDRTLKAMGEQDDIIRRMHAAVSGDTSRYRIYGQPADQQPVEGIVRDKGLHDELRGSLFAVVETSAGESYYVPVRGDAERVRVGDIVRVSVEADPWARPADANVVRIARSAGGVYTEDAHRKEITRFGAERGKPITAAELVAAHVRRLHRLAGLGLVEQLETGAWRVPPNLIEMLSSLDREKPQKKVTIRVLTSMKLDRQQAATGPTWLDMAPADTPTAPFGFGAEVSAAIEERARVLGRRGLDPNAPGKIPRLRHAERVEHGRKIERDTGLSFVPVIAKGSSFRGRCEQPVELASGQRIAVVRNEDARTFMVALAPRDVRQLEGQTIEVARGPDGRLALRPIPAEISKGKSLGR
jgi:type IV secretory pathway VirD2 relaxase